MPVSPHPLSSTLVPCCGMLSTPRLCKRNYFGRNDATSDSHPTPSGHKVANPVVSSQLTSARIDRDYRTRLPTPPGHKVVHPVVSSQKTSARIDRNSRTRLPGFPTVVSDPTRRKLLVAGGIWCLCPFVTDVHAVRALENTFQARMHDVN